MRLGSRGWKDDFRRRLRGVDGLSPWPIAIERRKRFPMTPPSGLLDDTHKQIAEAITTASLKAMYIVKESKTPLE